MVIHEVAAEGAALVHAIGEAVGLRVHEDGGGGDSGSIQENDAGVVFDGFEGDLIDEPDADSFFFFVIVNDRVNDGVRTQGHIPSPLRGGKGGGLTGKVSTEGTPAAAHVSIKAGPATERHLFRSGFREVGNPTRNEGTAFPLSFDGGLEIKFGWGEVHRRLEFAIGKLRETFLGAGDAGELFDVGIPRGEFVVRDGPGNRDAILGIGFHVHGRETVALLAPHQGATAGMVAAHPVETLFFLVRMILVIDEEITCVRAHGVAGAGLLGLLLQHLAGGLVEMVELPGGGGGRSVVCNVLNVVTALEHESFEAFFCQFLGGPTA